MRNERIRKQRDQGDAGKKQRGDIPRSPQEEALLAAMVPLTLHLCPGDPGGRSDEVVDDLDPRLEQVRHVVGGHRGDGHERADDQVVELKHDQRGDAPDEHVRAEPEHEPESLGVARGNDEAKVRLIAPEQRVEDQVRREHPEVGEREQRRHAPAEGESGNGHDCREDLTACADEGADRVALVRLRDAAKCVGGPEDQSERGADQEEPVGNRLHRGIEVEEAVGDQ